MTVAKTGLRLQILGNFKTMISNIVKELYDNSMPQCNALIQINIQINSVFQINIEIQVSRKTGKFLCFKNFMGLPLLPLGIE